MYDENHWRHYAECAGKWGIFDAVEDENGFNTYPHLMEARRTCFACPVWDECRAFGKTQSTGIYAGQGL